MVSEAMAAGTAVVGSRAGGIAEQIVAGESGLLFAQEMQRILRCSLGACLAIRLSGSFWRRKERSTCAPIFYSRRRF